MYLSLQVCKGSTELTLVMEPILLEKLTGTRADNHSQSELLKNVCVVSVFLLRRMCIVGLPGTVSKQVDATQQGQPGAGWKGAQRAVIGWWALAKAS